MNDDKSRKPMVPDPLGFREALALHCALSEWRMALYSRGLCESPDDIADLLARHAQLANEPMKGGEHPGGSWYTPQHVIAQTVALFGGSETPLAGGDQGGGLVGGEQGGGKRTCGTSKLFHYVHFPNCESLR